MQCPSVGEINQILSPRALNSILPVEIYNLTNYRYGDNNNCHVRLNVVGYLIILLLLINFSELASLSVENIIIRLV